MFYVFALCISIEDSVPGCVKTKTMKLIFTACLLSGQH